jgi:hypothetical protein
MSMPETGFFFPGPFHIPQPEDGERRIHLDGWMDLELTTSALQANPLRIKSGCPTTLNVDSVWVVDWNSLGAMAFLLTGFLSLSSAVSRIEASLIPIYQSPRKGDSKDFRIQ